MNVRKMTAVMFAAAALAGMGTMTAMADDPVVLVFSETNSIDSIDGQYAQFFKDKVEELTDGAVTIDIQASGVLGTEADVLDGMISMSGTVDIVRFSCYAFSNYGCKESALLGLPFVFESSEHFWNFRSGTGDPGGAAEQRSGRDWPVLSGGWFPQLFLQG